MFLDGGRPGDERGFVHKRLLGGVKGLIRGGPLAGVGGFLAPPGRPPPIARVFPVPQRFAPITTPRPTQPRTRTARPTRSSEREKELGRQIKLGATNGNGEFLGGDPECIVPGMRVDPATGKCKFFLGERAGPNGGRPVGDAIMGRYGAGLEPGIMTIDRAVCLRGMQLGDDGVCYNKSQISNNQRMWPKGRRPLLTGGDMRAISIASRAGKRLERTSKRLQSIGLMKKPGPRRVPPKAATVVLAHDHHHSDH